MSRRDRYCDHVCLPVVFEFCSAMKMYVRTIKDAWLIRSFVIKTFFKSQHRAYPFELKHSQITAQDTAQTLANNMRKQSIPDTPDTAFILKYSLVRQDTRMEL